MSDAPPEPQMPARNWPRIAANVAFAAFLASVLLGILLPVYTDEVGWRMHLRAGIDGGVDRMLSDICGPNTTAAPPWFMMPLRLAAAWTNAHFPGPLDVRLAGVGCGLVWAFLMRAVIGRIAGTGERRYILTALAFGLLGMGVLPLMMVMSRPDQIILLALTAALYIVAGAAQKGESEGGWKAWAAPLAIALLGLIAASYHMKGILIAPLILVCIWFAGKGRKALVPRIAALLLFCVLAAQGTHYWVERFRCPADPVLAEKLARQNVASALAKGSDLTELAGKAVVGINPNNYIMLAEARRFPMSDWLPRHRIDGEEALVRFMAMGAAWNLTALIALVCLLRALWLGWRERRIDYLAAVPLALAAISMVWGMSQRVRNDYEIMTALPMLALFCMFSLSGLAWTPRRQKQLAVLAGLIVAASIIGQIDIARRYYPPLRAAAQQTGYVKGQPFSISAFGYGPLRKEIRETARMCGIGAHGRAISPLVDDVTYFALSDSWRPYHRLGVLETWNGQITDPIAYLRSKGSEGLIVDCRELNPQLRAKATARGAYCCIPAR